MSKQNVGDQALVEDLTKDQEESPKRDVRKHAHRSPLKQGFLLQQFSKLPAAKKPKPRGTLWTVFRRGACKNASHFWADCMPCEEAGGEAKVAGVAENMAKHLKICPHAGPEARALVGAADDDDDDDDARPAKPIAKKLSMQAHFKPVPLAAVPSTAAEQSQFEQLVVKGTISANLPFSWIMDLYIRQAMKMLRGTVKFPHRQALSGEQTSFCCFHGTALTTVVFIWLTF